MGSPFGCLFGFLFVVVAILFVAFVNIVRMARDVMSAFGPKKRNANTSQRQQQTHTSSQSSTGQAQSATRRKVFEDGEGEYVDFEEVK